MENFENSWILIALAFVAVVILAILFPKGKRGEMSVAAILKRLPKEDYLVINDLLLRFRNWTSQIDHVVVSLFGVFVIETKNYQGWISGGENSDKWTQNIYGHKYELYNPVQQNFSHVRAIRKCLGDDGSIKIIPIVAFANKATLRIHADSAIVTYFFRLKRTIRSFSEPVLSDIQVREIYNTLLDANVIDRQERRDHKKEVKSNIIKREIKVANGICPRCGGRLVERSGQYGTFIGCSNYPRCRYTVNK